jgi:signal transduction histidine kinase
MFSLRLLLFIILAIITQPANSNSSDRREVHGQYRPKPMDTLKCFSEKKDLEILKSEKGVIAIRKKYILIYLPIILTSLFCLAFLTYRNIQNKRMIAELDKNIQQYKMQQVDKITLNNVKGNAVITSETVNEFNHALNTLDSSIDELRTVAHNMIPEALIELGLKDTLNDLCSDFDKKLDQHIIFQFFGKFERLHSYFEINAYTLMQELIINSIKNSGATELVVQMIQETNRLCFMLMDNGAGFDLSKETNMQNIRARIDAFNGQLEINAIPGKGTEFTIEFTF